MSSSVVDRDFVAAAEAVGRLPTGGSCSGEILPNILRPVMVETSLRLTYSIGLIAASPSSALGSAAGAGLGH